MAIIPLDLATPRETFSKEQRYGHLLDSPLRANVGIQRERFENLFFQHSVRGYASTMALVVPEHRGWAHLASLKMQVRAVELLRDKVEQHPPTLEESKTTVLPGLYGIFRTECINQNVPAAACHAKVLRSMFERGYFTLQLLIQTLYNDVELAVKKMHRTFLDVDVWCPKVLANTLTTIEEYIPLFQMTPRHFHPTITYPGLLALWPRRHFFAVGAYENPFPARKWQERSIGDMAFVYIGLRNSMEHGQLINMCFDLLEGRVFQEAGASERYVQAALVIALLYMARRNARECFIGGIDIRDASDELMCQLSHSITLAWTDSSPGDMKRFEDAFLWMLYVGTVHEQKRQETGRAVAVWFEPRLRYQARLMAVSTWSQMEGIAEKFLCTPLIEPNGWQWFEKMVALPSICVAH